MQRSFDGWSTDFLYSGTDSMVPRARSSTPDQGPAVSRRHSPQERSDTDSLHMNCMMWPTPVDWYCTTLASRMMFLAVAYKLMMSFC